MAQRIHRRRFIASPARQMPSWDPATVRRFADAEAALVNRRISIAAEENTRWSGWRNIGKGVLAQYGRLLVERRVDEIQTEAEKL